MNLIAIDKRKLNRGLMLSVFAILFILVLSLLQANVQAYENRLEKTSTENQATKNDFTQVIDEGSLRPVTKEEQIKINALVAKLSLSSFDDVLKGANIDRLTINFKEGYGLDPEDAYQLDDSFDALKKARVDFLTRLVQAYPDVSLQEFESNFDDTVLLATYLYRWEDIVINKHSLWNVMMFDGGRLRKDGSWSFSDLQKMAKYIQTRSKNGNAYLHMEDVNYVLAHQNIYNKVSGYKKFLEWFIQEETNSTDYSKWMENYFQGIIYKDKKMTKENDIGIWNRNFYDIFPYLFTLPKDSDVVLVETRKTLFVTSTKKQPPEKINEVLNGDVTTVNEYLSAIDRSMIDGKEKIDGRSEMIILDSSRSADKVGADFWRKVMLPANILTPINNSSAAYATGNRIQFVTYSLNSLNTLAHELTHNMDYLFQAKSEFFSTYQNRRNSGSHAFANFYGVEDFAETGRGDRTYTNKSPERFQSKQDLIDYAKRYEQLIFSMDSIVAEIILDMDPREQVHYLRKVNGDVRTGVSSSPSTSKLTEEAIREMQLKTIHDLIKNGLIIANYDAEESDAVKYSYGSSLTHADFFLAAGKSSGGVNQRMTNLMFAFNGWEGYRDYNNNLAKTSNNIEALRQTIGNDSDDFSTFLEKNYQEAHTSLKEKGLRQDTYEELKQLFKARIRDFYSVKHDLARKYLGLTKEFRTDIYSAGKEEPVAVSSYDQLYKLIEGNPYSSIKLTTNIEVIGNYAHKSFPKFQGSLDGNGYAFSKAKQPIFSDLEHAKVKHLVVKDSDIKDIETRNIQRGALANLATNTQIDDVHIDQANVLLNANNGSVKGNTNSGGMIGCAINSSIKNSSSRATVSGFYQGGMVGYATNTQLENVYSMGAIVMDGINKDGFGKRSGGIVGLANGNTTIQNAYSAIVSDVWDVHGIIGSTDTGSVKSANLINNLSLVDLKDRRKASSKIMGSGSKLPIFENNYEYEGGNGKTNVDNSHVFPFTEEQRKEPHAYRDKLKWDIKAVWDVHSVPDLGYPVLKNSDPYYKKVVLNIDKGITYDYKDTKARSKEAFLEDIHAEMGRPGIYETNFESIVDFEKPGKYQVNVKGIDLGENETETKTVTVVIKDTSELSIKSDDTIEYVHNIKKSEAEFLKDIHAELTVKGHLESDFSERVSFDKTGSYAVTVTGKSTTGRSVTKKVIVTIIPDKEVPIIQSKATIVYSEGEKISEKKFLEDIQVVTNIPSKVTSDFQKSVDFRQPNDYLVTITAEGESGKSAHKEITVTVYPLPVVSSADEISYLINAKKTEQEFLKDIQAKLNVEGTLTSDFNQKVQLDKTGDYEVSVQGEADKTGKRTTKLVTIHVLADPNIPVIAVKPSQTYTQLSSVTAERFLQDIHAKTSIASKITSDFTEKVDLKKPGVYVVTVTAVGATGKSSTQKVTVNVVEKPVVSSKAKISYVKNSNISEAKFLKDVQAKTNFVGKLSSDFKGTVILTKEGTYTVTISSMTPGGEKVTKQVQVVVKNNVKNPKIQLDSNITYSVKQQITTKQFLEDIHATILQGEGNLTSNFEQMVNMNKSGVYSVTVALEDVGDPHTVRVNVKSVSGKPTIKNWIGKDKAIRSPKTAKTNIQKHRVVSKKEIAKKKEIKPSKYLPQTGDDQSSGVWIGVLLVVMLFVHFKGRKMNSK